MQNTRLFTEMTVRPSRDIFPLGCITVLKSGGSGIDSFNCHALQRDVLIYVSLSISRVTLNHVMSTWHNGERDVILRIQVSQSTLFPTTFIKSHLNYYFLVNYIFYDKRFDVKQIS